MKILGISETDADSGAALLIDGKIVLAANEERFSRVKRHTGFPYKTISWIMKQAKLKSSDLDKVAIAKATTKVEMKTYLKSLWKEFTHHDPTAKLRWKLLDAGVWFGRNVPEHMFETMHLNKEINDWLEENQIPKSKVVRLGHHEAHAACAYYWSGFDTALVVTVDGQGMGVTATISEARNGKIKQIAKSALPGSPGNFYGMITKICGFTPNKHEGKITGLAAYGKEVPEIKNYVESIIECKNGQIIGHGIYGSYLKARQLYKKHGRENMSYAFQKRLEEVVTQYVNYYWKSRKSLKHIAMAGGVFANVKLNQRVMELPGVQQVFIFPHMADGGLSTGAAAMVEPKMKVQRLHDVYFGPGYTEKEMKDALGKWKVKYERPKELAKTVAKLINEGQVVARFGGRMEFGPRALGNRTIMYHTEDPSVNQWLNKNLKRSEFMPFAPVTLREKAEECYINFKKGAYAAEFMTITFDCTPWMAKHCPAVVHVDNTARPQVITPQINKEYYDIVHEYYKLTGIPTVVNTSFNMHEEPIVCSPDDAIRSFKDGHLDVLVIGPFITYNKKKMVDKK